MSDPANVAQSTGGLKFRWRVAGPFALLALLFAGVGSAVNETTHRTGLDQKADGWPWPYGPGSEGWTAIFTALLFLFTALLWRETKKAVVDTEASLALGRDTATAARLSAEAAMQEADIARRSGRPFVFASISALPQLQARSAVTPNSANFYTDVVFRNFGPHPAIVVSVLAFLESGDKPLELDPADYAFEGFEATVITTQDSSEPVRCVCRSPIAMGSNPQTGFQFPRMAPGESLFLRVKMVYDGALTEGHSTEACWYWSTPHLRFLVWGGSQYNTRL